MTNDEFTIPHSQETMTWLISLLTDLIVDAIAQWLVELMAGAIADWIREIVAELFTEWIREVMTQLVALFQLDSPKAGYQS